MFVSHGVAGCSILHSAYIYWGTMCHSQMLAYRLISDSPLSISTGYKRSHTQVCIRSGSPPGGASGIWANYKFSCSVIKPIPLGWNKLLYGLCLAKNQTLLSEYEQLTVSVSNRWRWSTCSQIFLQRKHMLCRFDQWTASELSPVTNFAKVSFYVFIDCILWQ